MTSFESKDSGCEFLHTSSETNTSDIFTKALPAASFLKHSAFLGVTETDLDGEAC